MYNQFMKVKTPLLIAIIITVIFGAVYVIGQQVLRRGANNEPTKLAQATVAKLKSGVAPRLAVNSTFNLEADNDSSFVVVYDKAGRVLGSGAFLNNAYPIPPKGVLTSATVGHNNKVTWQPATDLRLATVVINTGNYYVLGARSLKLSEEFQDVWLFTLASSWATSMIVIFTTLWFLPSRLAKRLLG